MQEGHQCPIDQSNQVNIHVQVGLSVLSSIGRSHTGVTPSVFMVSSFDVCGVIYVRYILASFRPGVRHSRSCKEVSGRMKLKNRMVLRIFNV